MGFVMYCDNKGCGKSQEPYLDKETDQVYCAECGETIKNVTQFAKNSMRGMSQFKKTVKAQQAFSVKCESCSKTAQPKLLKKTLLCPHCGKEHKTLQAPYAHAIKEYLLSNPVSTASNKQ